MPPLMRELAEAGRFHHMAKHAAILEMRGREKTLSVELIFELGLRDVAEVVEAGAHVEFVPLSIEHREIHGETEVMQRAWFGARDVAFGGGTFDMAPKNTLDGARAKGVEDDEAVLGAFALQEFAREVQLLGRQAMKEGAPEGAIHVDAHEVVRGSVAKIDVKVRMIQFDEVG